MYIKPCDCGYPRQGGDEMPRVPDSQAVLSAKKLLFHPVPLRACVVHPLPPVTSKHGVGAPQCIHSWETLGRGSPAFSFRLHSLWNVKGAGGPRKLFTSKVQAEAGPGAKREAPASLGAHSQILISLC